MNRRWILPGALLAAYFLLILVGSRPNAPAAIGAARFAVLIAFLAVLTFARYRK